MNFDVLIVVYNKPVADLPVIPQLLDENLIKKIIICDNSDNGANSCYVPCERIIYLPMEGNLGLSRAYNIGKRHADAPYLCILDDDTFVPKDYFSSALSYIKNNSADLLLPIVRSESMILSPCRKIGPKFFAVTHVNQLHAKKISAVNSGMLISAKVYSCLNYDEELFLDFVDHDFMDNITRCGYQTKIMISPTLTQSFSGDSEDYESLKKRFSIYKRDAEYYYSKSNLTRFYLKIVLAWKQINAFAKYGRFF